MTRIEELIGRVAASLVRAACAHRLVTIGLSIVLAGAGVALAVGLLHVDTDSSRLLSPDRPVGRTNRALVALFPSLQDNVVVMIEADDADDARDAAVELRDRLVTMRERYVEVFLPGYGDYYDDFGVLHLERDELEDFEAAIDRVGELLATLADRGELPILLGALAHVINEEGVDSLGTDGARLLDRVTRTVERFRAGDRTPIDWEDLLFADVDAGFTNPQLLFVQPVGDLTQLEPVLKAVRHLRSLVPELEPRPGLRVRVTGDRATHSEEMSLIFEEVVLAAFASLALISLVLLYSLRSPRLAIATLLTLAVGLSWTAGFAALVVGELNVLTSAFAVVYIGLGVDFGIHFALGYLDRRDAGGELVPSLHATGSGVGSALFLCAITTTIGFFAFVPTDYAPVVDMGIISGTSVLLGLLATLTCYPALIALGLGPSDASVGPLGRRWELPLPTFAIRHPKAVCAVAAGIAMASSVAVFFVRFEFSTLKVRDPRVESVQALEDLLRDPELSVWTADIIARDVDEAIALARALEPLDGIEEVRTPASFLPEDQDERLAILRGMREVLSTPVELTDEESGRDLDRLKAVEYTSEGYAVALDIVQELRGEPTGDDPVWSAAGRLRAALDELIWDIREEALSEQRLDALEQDLFSDLGGTVEDVMEALPTRAVTLADLPTDLMSRYLAADGRARVEVLSSAYLNGHGELERFADLVSAVRPDAGGPVPGAVELGRSMVSSLRQALLTSVAVIAILLVLLLRSIRYTMFTLVPLALGSLATAAISVVADIPFNFANVIVLPLILGIGVDSGIHLVHRHRAGLQGAPNLLATSTTRAVLFSALTTLLSFGTLAAAHHQGIASLAKLLSVGILLMLASNVIVLPALLAWLDPTSGRASDCGPAAAGDPP